MGAPGDPNSQTPQDLLREVVALCADCDTCRTLMDRDCAFFPELYRLWDEGKRSAAPIFEADLRRLAELCTFCGLCPCPRIPVDVMRAKSGYVEQEGLPAATRWLIDVPRLARVCGTFPRLTKALQESRAFGPRVRKALRLHPERQLPLFPKQNFFQWAAARGYTRRPEGKRTVTYFAGCTAGYLFPQVGQAAVEVLERNGLAVYVPPQQCCGMPHLVEGDRQGTLERARTNMDRLLESVRAGDDLVCSCPTCGFFLKVLLKERACYSEAYQRSVNAGEDEFWVPLSGPGEKKHKVVKKSIYRKILQDDGYFASLDPLDRIALSDHLFDAGEYLARLLAEGSFDARFGPLPGRMVYFAPCHQREQTMGLPYPDLLARIPGLTVEPVGATECCGMGGNFGFKDAFHQTSLAVGDPLMAAIRERNPQAIVTDCLSCRLQFRQQLPYPVFHPLEILAHAYARTTSTR